MKAEQAAGEQEKTLQMIKAEQRRRSTVQRQAVLAAVQRRTDHPTADEIYLDLRRRLPQTSKGTVYRNLIRLTDENEIARVEVPGGPDRYDYRTERHDHMRCLRCGAVSDAPTEYSEEQDRLAAKMTGFQVHGHTMVFEGVCPACLK